ncbi:MAG: glycosyltransferase [Candidatus Nanosalina sp.]
MREVSVVVPTYNEEENIKDFLEEVGSELEDYNYEILIVDDSDDATAEIVKEMQEENDRISILEREGKRGIGSAYKEGFEAAEGEKIVQMDADFSHRPDQVEKLLEALEENDVAVGSRYVSGGKRQDPVWRRINPLIGSYIYRYALGSPVADVTSGFKAYRHEILEELPEELPDGFHFQAASLMALLDSGADIEEVAIDFQPRRAGEPKYSLEDLLDNIKLMLRLFQEKRLKYR